MGRRSAAGAGAAAQAEASVTMGKEEAKRKRSTIYVKKTIVKPQSPTSKESNSASKLPPSPPPMSKARGTTPQKPNLSPPRIRGGRVISPSPMSKPRLNNHYTPPRYQSPPRSRMRGPSPPPPVGIRGRVARGLSPSRSSPSPPLYGSRERKERPPSPPRLPPSPVLVSRIRASRHASPSRLPPSPVPTQRTRGGGRHASPSRLPPSPVPGSRAREGRHASPSRLPPSPVPRSRSRGGRNTSPPRLPPSPHGVRGTRVTNARRRSPSPPSPNLQISPQSSRRNAGLGRRDAAIREITSCQIEPIPSTIYQRLSPINLVSSNKRGRSPSPSPPPSYHHPNLTAKPPLPPQALSSRRPRSPTPVGERVLQPLPSGGVTKRSPSPVLKRRYSCVTVLPRDITFSDLHPHLPPPPPTAPTNFRRITPNFAARRSRKASFVILNEATVKRKSESRRASVDGTEVQLDAEGKVKMPPRSHSVEGATSTDAKNGTGKDGKSKEESSGTKSGNGKNGRTKAVSIILLPDEDEPETNGKKPSGKGNGEGKKGKDGKTNGSATKGDGSGDSSAAGGTSSAVASSDVIATAGGVAVTSPLPGAQVSADGTPTGGDASSDQAGGATTPTVAATAAATVTAGSVTPGVVTAATTPRDGTTKTGTPVQEEMVSQVVKGEADVESMGPNQMAPPGLSEGSIGGIRDQKQILEAGALGSSRASIASTHISTAREGDIMSLQMGTVEEGVSGSITGAPSDEAGSVEAFPGVGDKDGSSKEGSIRRHWKSDPAEKKPNEKEEEVGNEEDLYADMVKFNPPYLIIDVTRRADNERPTTDSSMTASPITSSPSSPFQETAEAQTSSEMESGDSGPVFERLPSLKESTSDTSEQDGSSEFELQQKILLLKQIEEIDMRIEILRMEVEKVKIVKELEAEKLQLEVEILKKQL